MYLSIFSSNETICYASRAQTRKSVRDTRKFSRIKQRHMYGLALGCVCFTANERLKVSIHPERPATGQTYPNAPCFSSDMKQILNRYTNSTLHCFRFRVALPTLNSNLKPKCNAPQLHQNVFKMQPPKYKVQNSAQMLNFFLY